MRKTTLLSLTTAALMFAFSIAPGQAASQASSANRAKPSAASHATAAAGASLLKPASLKLQAPAVFNAKFVTSKGDFVIEVTRAWSPRGADRFYNLVKYHFFDDAAFFRVLPSFVVQFGISPRPEVSRVWESARIIDDPVTQSNRRGTVTFATAGPNTRTTQMFINLADNVMLDTQGFSPIGKVASGMEVVEKFYSEYGEGAPNGNGPDQGRVQKEGRAYLQQHFPLLDTIKSASIVPATTPAAHSPATASK